jgi:RecJ-like exonuclease
MPTIHARSPFEIFADQAEGYEECPWCDGYGELDFASRWIASVEILRAGGIDDDQPGETCPHCRGSGRKPLQ